MLHAVSISVTDGNLPPIAASELTATQLAELTGVAPGTLRVWETRYGFPAAQRLPGDRKRYSERDVDQIRAVLAHRRSGLSLTAAIRQVRAETPDPPPSMYAALREARPDLVVRVFPKPLLIALSHAIEDEQAARSTGGVLIGSFQREVNYRACERRWQALSRTTELTVVLADFPRFRDSTSGPVEVPMHSAPPLEREWSVVLHSPTASACLAAWEVPAPRELPDSERLFEFVWSCDPATTRAAVLAAGQLLGSTAPQVAERIPSASINTSTGSTAHHRFSDELTSRAFSYLATALAPV